MFFLMTVVVAVLVVRILMMPFRYRHRSRWFGYDPYYNPYRYGCRRHHRLLGGILPIVALVALDRIFFNRRYW